MALKFSMVLEAVDRASAPARKVKASVGGLVSGFRAWGQQVRKVSSDINSGARSLEFYQTRARRLRQVALGSFFRAARLQARQFGESLRSGIRNLNLMERAGKAARAGIGSLGSKMASLAKWGVAGAAAAGGFSLFDLFKTAGQFEQYRIAFQVAEGSAEKAKAKMAWISKFAADTPYELDQVIEAFRNLQSVAGVDPTDGSLEIVGDAAAGLSKDLMQVSEAYSDAVNMQFERLLDLGLRATQAGDKVTFAYRKNGKALTKTVKKDGLEIKKALEAIWKDQFGGSTLAQSKSLFGILSNIKDLWGRFQVMVADAGIFDKVKGKLTEWYDRLNTMASDGSLQAWAQGISDALGQAFDWATNLVENTNWKQFGSDLQKIASAAWTLAKGVADAVLSFQQWQAGRAAKLAENTEQGWFTSSDAKSKARQQRQSLERQFGPLTDTGRAEDAQRQRRGQFYRVTPGGPEIPMNQGLLRRPRAGMKPSGQGATQVGGAVDINVKVSGAANARVERVASVNRAVPLRVNTGRIMDGAA